MNAIRVHTKIESETIYLPELKPLIGKHVEIIVLEEEKTLLPGKIGHYDAFFELAGENTVDPEAYQELRAMSR